MPRFTTMRLSGWGNYPVHECRVARPERLDDLRDVLGDRGGNTTPTVISRGLGRGYGDSALNPAGVLLHERLNRILGFDAERGTLECEAGVSLAQIIEAFLPRGFFPPVTPGTRFVTIGGAIAADVHGKNHHREGSIGNFILGLKLLTAAGEVLNCGPADNADVFWATVGGMGLTGIILSATLKLRRVPSAYVNLETQRAANLDAALELFDAGDERHLYSVAWIDCLAGGRSLGRSVLDARRPRRGCRSSGNSPRAPLAVRGKRAWNVRFNFPPFVLNPLTVRAFNGLYFHSHPDRRQVVPYEPFFYPLDSVLHWNRLYGRRGFVQYQAFFPRHSSQRGLVALLEKVAGSGRASFLAVLKSCGPADPALRTYLGPGHTLALDLPCGTGMLELVRELDKTLLNHGGRLYLAKDACMDEPTFAAMYPNLAKFREIKARIDPGNRFVSAQARRVGIVPPGVA